LQYRQYSRDRNSFSNGGSREDDGATSSWIRIGQWGRSTRRVGSLISDSESEHEEGERERGGAVVTMGDRGEEKMRSYRMFIASRCCFSFCSDSETSLEASSSSKEVS